MGESRIVVVDVYARPGDKVTCEDGHHICTFANLVHVGDDFDSAHLTDWQQPEPVIGTIEQPCTVCGKKWFDEHWLHFENGWR